MLLIFTNKGSAQSFKKANKSPANKQFRLLMVLLAVSPSLEEHQSNQQVRLLSLQGDRVLSRVLLGPHAA